jgi:hypothetical protein
LKVLGVCEDNSYLKLLVGVSYYDDLKGPLLIHGILEIELVRGQTLSLWSVSKEREYTVREISGV